MNSDENALYKLIILGSNWDLYKCAYSDVLTNNVKYVPGHMPVGKFYQFLYKFHNSPKTNSIINIPFKSAWNKYYFSNLDNTEKYVFLIFPLWLSVDPHLNIIDYIRKHFIKSKIVLFLQDIVSSMGYLNVDVVKYFPKFDLVISYDKDDAQKYNLSFHNTVFSAIKSASNTKPYYDVFFIGKDKGRLPLISQIYTRLSDYGLKCKFILLNVPDKDKLLDGKIDYIDCLIPYKENLEYVEHANCLLEILQPGASGITYRTLESIAYNKILLTNNTSLSQTGLYDESYCKIFTSVSDFTDDFIGELKDIHIEENPFCQEISPKNLVKFIEKSLCINIIL